MANTYVSRKKHQWNLKEHECRKHCKSRLDVSFAMIVFMALRSVPLIDDSSEN